MASTTFDSAKIKELRSHLTRANLDFNKNYPGISHARQPVHTVYGGAHLFTANTAKKISDTALKIFNEHASAPIDLARALNDEKNKSLWEIVHPRVVQKLKSEAVEDFRIDFEDGYGNRPDAEEDGHAESTALEVAKGMKENSLPPFIGIRVKTFNEELVARSIRTIDIFMTTLLKATGGNLPQNFVITLPKITIVEQAEMLTSLLAELEAKLKLPAKLLKFEIMVEMPQSIIDRAGAMPLRSFVEAGKGRCIGAHFGTYDYTAGCNITAHEQRMDNPVCDFAKHVMQVSLTGLPLFLSDGATNVMPVGDRETIYRAWRLSHSHITHSLTTGFYQGWDLHPAQLPIRYATIYSFFLSGLDAASQRLKAFVEKAAKATLLGDVFDDAATGQGLLNFFLRGMSCGAITQAEALATGLTIDEFNSRSFLKILENRKLK